MRTLVINSSNYVGANQYTYNLPQTVKFEAGDQVGVSSIAVYNSTFNITSARGNNVITFVWNGAIWMMKYFFVLVKLVVYF